MTQLITPAKSHDNKYPKPTPDYPSNQQTNATFALPVLTAVNVNNDAASGGVIALPEGHSINLSNIFDATVTEIQLSEKNFHPQNGLMNLTFSTSNEYPVAPLNFILNGKTASQLQIYPGRNYSLIFGLSKNAVGENHLIIIRDSAVSATHL